jgi:benzoylformate decarboxylase
MRQLKLTTIFGNPGSTEETFLESFPEDFKYALTLHEASAVAMADAYAQVTGEAVLVNLHTAAGVGNAMGNIASAWHNRAPLIITAGQQTREMLLIEPFLTNIRATELPRPYVKWSYQPVRAEDVPGALMRAYAMAVQPPAGPVFLSIPMDDLRKEYPHAAAIRAVSRSLPASIEALQPVADGLASAVAPALVLGGAVDQRGGWYGAVLLAERLQCPVWAAPHEGRPGFPETHPLYRGELPSAIGPLGEQLEGHDLVVVIGAPVFRYYPYVPGVYLPAGTRLIHITDDPAEAARAPVGDSVLSCPGRACTVLANLVPQAQRPPPAPMEVVPASEPGKLITADFVYQTLNALRPSDSVIVHETPSNEKVLRRRLPASRPCSSFAMSSGILGYGLPAAVGVAMAERTLGTRRKVICIVGDGSAQYVIQALWSAAQHRLPILFVILRNGEYAILKAFARFENAPDVPGLDIPGIDCVRLAQGYGCEARRVTAPGDVEGVLRQALDSTVPSVVEVVIDPEIPPLL